MNTEYERLLKLKIREQRQATSAATGKRRVSAEMKLSGLETALELWHECNSAIIRVSDEIEIRYGLILVTTDKNVRSWQFTNLPGVMSFSWRDDYRATITPAGGYDVGIVARHVQQVLEAA